MNSSTQPCPVRWLTPKPCPAGVTSALRSLITPRAGLLQATLAEAQIKSGLSLWLAEKRERVSKVDAALLDTPDYLWPRRRFRLWNNK